MATNQLLWHNVSCPHRKRMRWCAPEGLLAQVVRHGAETIALAEKLDKIRASEGIVLTAAVATKPLDLSALFAKAPSSIKVNGHQPCRLHVHPRVLRLWRGIESPAPAEHASSFGTLQVARRVGLFVAC